MLCRWPLVCGALLCCGASAALRAADRIDTDGPDFVESTEVVGVGRWQFETGPYAQRDTRDGARLRTLNTPLLLKAGVSDSVEARLETDGYARLSGSEAGGEPVRGRSGMTDAALGFKWHSRDSDAASGMPAVAWIAHLQMPSGGTAWHGQGLRPSLRAVLGWSLPGEFSLGVMPGLKIDSRDDGHRYAAGILGVVLGRWWTPRTRIFIEGAAESIARQQDGGVILYKNVGAAYLLSDTWQIGGRAGWAANRNTPSRYFMLSLAGRF